MKAVFYALFIGLAGPAKALSTIQNISTRVAEEPATYEEPSTKEYPLYGSIAAGKPTPAIDQYADSKIAVAGNWPDGCFVLKINGHSMEPTYAHGHFVLIRPLALGEWPIKNHVYAWVLDGGTATLKQLTYSKEGKKTTEPRKPTPHLTSLNPQYPEIIPQGEARAIGEVIATFESKTL